VTIDIVGEPPAIGGPVGFDGICNGGWAHGVKFGRSVLLSSTCQSSLQLILWVLVDGGLLKRMRESWSGGRVPVEDVIGAVSSNAPCAGAKSAPEGALSMVQDCLFLVGKPVPNLKLVVPVADCMFHSQFLVMFDKDTFGDGFLPDLPDHIWGTMRSRPVVMGAVFVISVAGPSIGRDEKAVRGSDIQEGGSL
jgi:hypothetical protein